MKPGIADVWLCEDCGTFMFTKPEIEHDGIYCPTCDNVMGMLPEQAVFTVQVRERPA